MSSFRFDHADFNKVRDEHENIAGEGTLQAEVNGKCRGPGVGMSQVCLRIGKEASGARAESARRGWQEVGTRAMGLDRMLLGSWLSPRMRWGYH